ncbi:MAG: sulfatase [Verrucomicrobiota bacterium]|nr:sulfatase [Verrucomicrobiota bacterium]
MIRPAFLLSAFLILHSALAAEPVKNVLFIVSDDLRASVLGCYGDKVCATPNIDRLAARGMVFERAYCQGTVCGPSRASFMRGRYFGNSGGITLGEHFIAQGRNTARVGKIFHMRVPGDIIAGTDGDDVAACWSQRFNSPGQEAHTPGDYACLNLNIFTNTLEGRQSTGDPHRPFVTVGYDGDGSDQPDAKTAAKTVELLRKFKAERKPFLIAAGFVRPHYPMVAPRPCFDRYPHAKITLPPVPENDLADIPPPGIPNSNSKRNGLAQYPENQQRMWAGYYAAVTFMDAQLGRILDELDRLGLADSTAIVFTSDHGYHLGDHTFWQKANLHEQVTRVPLIIAAPGVKPGRSKSIVQLVDVFPTLCDLTGAPTPPSVEGKSLVLLLRDPAATVHEAAFSYDGAHHALRTARWGYMRYTEGSQELYDMNADPGQFTNLARIPAHTATLANLRQQLDQRVKASGASKGKGKKKAKN